MRHTSSIVAAATLLVCSSPRVGAQTSPPTFKTGVDLVRMDVRVTDADGVPIRDLRADEVSVSDGGQRAPVVFFQHIEEPTGTYDDVAWRTIRGEVSTNRGAPRGHLYVLVFDQQHIAAGNEQRARLAAQRFLKTRVKSGDRVAVFALPGPGPQLRFTGDMDRAIAELPAVRGGLERMDLTGVGAMQVYEAYQIVRGDPTMLARVVSRLSAESAPTEVLGGSPQARQAAAENSSDSAVFARAVKENAGTIVAKADGDARRFLLLLTRLMREMRAIDGRKTVVLLSEGFFADHVTRELEDAAAAAAQSYSVVHAIDLNRRGPSPADADARGGDQQREEQSRLEPLGSLALETDGRLFVDGGTWLERAFGAIAAESQDYYIVGFTPRDGASRNRSSYRRVTIRVSRRGARVSSRTGYALDTPDLSPTGRRRAIDTAFAAPFPEQGFPVELTTYVRRGTVAGVETVALVVAADIPAAGDRQGLPVDVVFAVQNVRSGRIVSSGTDAVTPETTDVDEPKGAPATWRVQFDAPPGDYIARVVVREAGGLVASADRRFEVRNLDGPALGASDLVVGSRHNALPVRLRTSAADILNATFELYGRSNQLDDVDVRVSLSPLGEETALRTIHAELLDTDESDRGARRTALIEMPLSEMPPGRYLVRASVTSDGTTTSTVTREIEIVPGEGLRAVNGGAQDREPTFTPALLLNGAAVHRYLDAQRRSTPALAKAIGLAAAGAWKNAEAVVGTDPAAAGVRGLARLAQRDYAAASMLLAAALDADRGNAAIAFFLGWAQSASGDRPKAISAWRRAVFIDATFVPAHLALADAYLEVGERALALQALRAGLTALPASPELLDRLSRVERR